MGKSSDQQALLDSSNSDTETTTLQTNKSGGSLFSRKSNKTHNGKKYGRLGHHGKQPDKMNKKQNTTLPIQGIYNSASQEEGPSDDTTPFLTSG